MRAAKSIVVNQMEARRTARSIRRGNGGLSGEPLARTYARASLRRAIADYWPVHGVKSVRVLDYDVLTFHFRVVEYLLEEIFIDRQYHFATQSEAPFILDCGANIGMSVLFFKSMYPKSRVVAFEPDPETFELLQRNVTANGLNGVELVQKAVHSSDGEISFYIDPDNKGNLVMSTREDRLAKNEELRVPATRLSEYVTGPVDFLKLDVEGAEHVVLAELAESGKLPLIDQMVIEYHHHVDPTQDRLAAFLGVLENGGFGYQMYAKRSIPPSPLPRQVFQDMLIHAYRRPLVTGRE